MLDRAGRLVKAFDTAPRARVDGRQGLAACQRSRDGFTRVSQIKSERAHTRVQDKKTLFSHISLPGFEFHMTTE
jgi:hypothetical protein